MRAAIGGMMLLLDRVLDWFVAAVVAFLALIVASQFVDRYLVDIPISAPDVYVRVGLAWLTFVGFAAAVRAGENIRIELIDHVLGSGGQRALAVVFDLMLLVVLVMLVIKGWTVFEVGQAQLLIGTPLTVAVPSAALVVGSALLILFVGIRLAARVAGVPLPHEHRDEAAIRRDPV